MAELDLHGQPLDSDSNRRRRAERDLSEILGIVKGTLADGIVVDTEIAFLHQWAQTHPDALEHWLRWALPFAAANCPAPH